MIKATIEPPIALWPIAVDAVAAIFQLSWRAHAFEKVRLPIRCSRSCRWLLGGPTDLRAWAKEHCPSRDSFHATREAQ